jgi:anti-sigma regulatory factor (Ser/Thr protein kinase)
MSPKPFRFEITIGSDTRYLAALRSMVGAFLRHAGNGSVGKASVIACSMALVEAVDNAIFHAHRNRRSLPIRIALSLMDSRVVMDVVDTGRGIGELHTEEPDIHASHGRGLHIIRESMSRVTSKVGAGEHRLRMIRDL